MADKKQGIPVIDFGPFLEGSKADQRAVAGLLHYPPLPEGFEPHDGESRAGAHTDYGSVTLFFQDDVGGPGGRPFLWFSGKARSGCALPRKR